MLRRHCRTCGSEFLLQDNEVHTKCPVHRSTTVAGSKPAARAGGKAKGKAKRKR